MEQPAESFVSRGKMVLCVLLTLSGLAIGKSTQVPGAVSEDGLWRDIEENRLLADPNGRLIVPDRYRMVRLDLKAFSNLISGVPMEFTEEARRTEVIMTLPMPEGGFERFRITESPMMAPELARLFPEIKTYSAQGIDDPTAVGRLDRTPAGFHALILSERQSVYIEPYSKNDATTYISYFTIDYRNRRGAWQCYFRGNPAGLKARGAVQNAPVTNATPLRTFRLAIAATGEYTIFHGGTVDKGLAAITTTMNRVNGIYERDFGIRYILIEEEPQIIYTDPATDPYTNDDNKKLPDENQANLDQTVGDANYDLGHVFSTGDGGVGAAGLCMTGGKAMGATGLSQPVGDKFDVEYVAHEMIHQLSGNHTFNSTQDGCGGENRNQETAFEPGSGSTATSYASLCGVADLQTSSDDYFHSGSLEEVLPYVSTSGTCAKLVETGNRAPTVNPGSDHTIPKLTPFTLTAVGSDPDGDALTYVWEQFDTGQASPPEEDDGTRPIFRSFKPTASPSRTFPRLTHILNDKNVPPPTYTQEDRILLTGEQLPSKSRTMKFRVTARDNRAGGGGVATAGMNVTVFADAGPFSVTEPNTAVTWNGGTTQAVRWDVSGTAAAPISSENVRILLSTDGGLAFPIVLAESVPNNGSASIQVPNVASTKARIKVEAVGNIFFDISDTDFTIQASSAPTTSTYFAQFANGDQWVSSFVGTNPSSTTTVSGTLSFNSGSGQPLAISVNGGPAEASVAFVINPLGSVIFTTNGLGSLATGSVRVSSDNPIAGVIRFSHPSLGIAGVGESAALESLMTPIVRDASKGLNTGIALANASSSPVDVTLSLRGLNGREVSGGSASLNLAGSGHTARFIDELFNDADTASFEGTLVVTATAAGGKIAATSIQLGSKLGEFTTLPVVPVSPPSTTKELYFAQYANGGSWSSSIFATNGLSGAAQGELTVYDDDGNELAVAFNGQPASNSTPVTIASMGGAVFTTDGLGSLVSGSARMIADSAIGGVLRFAAPGLGLAGVGASSPVPGFITPIRRSSAANLSTGVAIASVGSTVTLTLTLRGKDGQAVANGVSTITLKENGHVARFVEQLFPEADTSDFEGTLTVTAAGGNIVGTAIQLGAKAGEITTLPVTELRP